MGDDVNTVEDGHTPLTVALGEGKTDIAKFLLSLENVSLQLQEKQRRLPLNVAIRINEKELVVKMLNDDRVNVFEKVKDGFDALKQSILCKNVEIFELVFKVFQIENLKQRHLELILSSGSAAHLSI